MHKILVIGSGGIGTELLKNLYLSRHKNITIIDFDTIAITNLNRQFFYKAINVNDYKAKVASEAYKKKVKTSGCTFHIKKIQDFDFKFFKQYDIVYNCLDNNEARKYVNIRCLLGNIPLIDGGSTGFLGQAQYFSKISCFDCLEEEIKKEYPICSIRLVPEKYEHCVIWAKSIFFEEYVCGRKNQEYSEEELLYENNDTNNNQNVANEDKVGDKIHNTNICKNTESYNHKDKKIKIDYADKLVSLICKPNYILTELDIKTVEKIQKNIKEITISTISEFDKDNKVLMNLIHNVATLRSISFNIQPQQQIETENIAGNIIPAICTTNSIVASLMKIMGDKVLNKKTQQIHNHFITHNKIIQKIKIINYNKECKTCKSTFYIYKKKEKSKLSHFLELLKQITKNKFMILSDTGLVYDTYYKENEDKEFVIEHNNFFYVVDEDKKRFTFYVIAGKQNEIIKM